MDNYWSKQPKVFTLIKVLFGMLATTMAVAVALVFFLKINETVSFSAGEILSRNAPIEYRAAYDARVEQVRVKEGHAVHKGDTLLVLTNESLVNQYKIADEGYCLALANAGLFRQQLQNLEQKFTELQGQNGIINSRYSNQATNGTIELSALEKQVKWLEAGLLISGEQIAKDLHLMETGAISQLEYQTNYQKHLDKINVITELRKQRDLQKNAGGGLATNRSEEENSLKMLVLSNNFDQVELKKKLLDEEAKSQELGNQASYLLAELKKLVIIADIDGHISRLFNTHREIQYVSKGASLLTLRPDVEESFYAKVTIPQASVSKIDTGQEVHLKLNAYNHYQYGILKGKVEHISRQDTTDNFYVLANIVSKNPSIEMKSGYQVRGDVVLRKVRLYRFIMNRLFRKMEV